MTSDDVRDDILEYMRTYLGCKHTKPWRKYEPFNNKEEATMSYEKCNTAFDVFSEWLDSQKEAKRLRQATKGAKTQKLQESCDKMRAELAEMESQLRTMATRYYEIPDSVKIEEDGKVSGLGVHNPANSRVLYYDHEDGDWISERDNHLTAADCVLVPVDKADMEVGDVVHMTDRDDMKSAKYASYYYVCLSDGKYVRQSESGGCYVSSIAYKHGYKVVKRSEVSV